MVDDISTDNSYNPAKQIIEGDDRYIIIKNTQKKFALKNIIDWISLLEPNDEDVIMTIDIHNFVIMSQDIAYLEG